MVFKCFSMKILLVYTERGGSYVATPFGLAYTFVYGTCLKLNMVTRIHIHLLHDYAPLEYTF